MTNIYFRVSEVHSFKCGVDDAKSEMGTISDKLFEEAGEARYKGEQILQEIFFSLNAIHDDLLEIETTRNHNQEVYNQYQNKLSELLTEYSRLQQELEYGDICCLSKFDFKIMIILRTYFFNKSIENRIHLRLFLLLLPKYLL